MAVPFVYIRHKHISSASIAHCVEEDELVRESGALFTAATPLLLSIVGNILTMSKDTRIALSDIPLAFSA